MIPDALIAIGLVLALITACLVVVVLQLFGRLAFQQQQIDALGDALRRLREGSILTAPSTGPHTLAIDVAVPAAPLSVLFAPGDSTASEPQESLETLIGGRWLLYVGVVAIVFGVAYFEKLAFESHWVSETARVIQGGLGGLALIYAGMRFGRAGYPAYGQMISGCGAAILYVSTYAAFNFYHLIDRPAAFGLMTAITAGTAWLADHQRSQGLAVLAVGGGFATPFMLPATADPQLALFGYDVVLIAGTLALSRRRDWPFLDVISYVFTLAAVAFWAIDFYTSQKFLRTEVFLTIFLAMFLAIINAHRRSASSGVMAARWILWTVAPVYWVASLAVLFDHPTATLVWIVAMAVTAAILTAAAGVAYALSVWIVTALPLLLWCAAHLSRDWLAPGLITVVTIYAVALAAQLYREAERMRFDWADVAWLHLNAMVTFAGAYMLIEATWMSAAASMTAGFAVWHGVLAAGLRTRNRDRALHFAGVAFTLAMIAIALQFDGEAVTIGWAAEGAIAIALSLRERRDWLRVGGAALFLIALLRTAWLLMAPGQMHQAPLLNARAACALFVVTLCYALAWLHVRRDDSPAGAGAAAAAIIAAQLVTVTLVTSEIDAHWFARADALTRELAKSVAWAVYATLLIVIGLRRDYAPIRYFAILLFAVTSVKVFFVDTAQLERIYRILSVIGLGIALLVTSYLYQRTRRENRLTT